jgi:uncharacterized protein GlcG (DUF336 family)
MKQSSKTTFSGLALVAIGAAVLVAPAAQAESTKKIARRIDGTTTSIQTGVTDLQSSVKTLQTAVSSQASQPDVASCVGLPTHAQLTAALKASVAAKAGGTAANPAGNGGLDIPMWATVVGRDGTVCAVTFSGAKFDDQWPASRVISAQKANTTNSLTTTNTGALAGSANLAGVWSTARLYSAVQPGGSLFGLQESNPVNTIVAYQGAAADFGQANDPMVGFRIGGNNVFGGGVALFDTNGKVIGGLGVSGDTSCADHNVAWRTRIQLGLDRNPAPNPGKDNIVFDIVNGKSTSGFGHPTCLDSEPDPAKNKEVLINKEITGLDPTKF